MHPVLSLVREKTILEMDSGWGVPLGVLLLLGYIIHLLRNNSTGPVPPDSGASGNYKGFADYKPSDWKAYDVVDEQRRRAQVIKQTKAAQRASRTPSQNHEQDARDVGTTLIELLNDTAERTGHSAEFLCAMVRDQTQVPIHLEGSNKLTATPTQLVMMAPHMETLRECFEGMEKVRK